jgi:S1-C subfamily serine protease
MTMTLFALVSDALADQVAAAAPRVAALQLHHGHHLTATLWRADLALASEQSLPRRDTFPIVLPDGAEGEAAVIGRDDGTNLALLRFDRSTSLDAPPAAKLRTGGFALALGARRDGGATACLGVVNQVGPAWHSQRGGRIDAFIKLDLGMSPYEEGGPVLGANGGIAGITTFGPRGQVIVIPHATIERIVPTLEEKRRVARGWLGAALQPVAVPEGIGEEAGRGFLVMSTQEGSPAREAGLLPGDILLAVGGQALWRFSQLSARLGPESLGQPLALRVLRGGSVTVVDVTVAERPAP